MKCSSCQKPISGQFREEKVTKVNREALRKAKHSAREGETLKICDDCFREHFPAFSIRLGPPTPFALSDNVVLMDADEPTKEMREADKEAVRKRVDELNNSALPEHIKKELKKLEV